MTYFSILTHGIGQLNNRYTSFWRQNIQLVKFLPALLFFLTYCASISSYFKAIKIFKVVYVNAKS